MKNMFRIAAFLLPAVMLFLISCVHSPKEVVIEKNNRSGADAYVAEGRYEKALGIYRELLSRNDHDPQLLQDYIATIQVLNEMAEYEYTLRNYAASERIDRLLLAEIEMPGPLSALVPLHEKTINVRIRESRIGHAMKLSQQHMNSENFLMALNSLKVVHMQYPEDDALLGHYIERMEQIKKHAEKAFGKENYPVAGRAYHALNRQVSYIEKVAAEPLFDGKSFDMRMTFCSSRLMKQALERYRNGDLPAAITLWKNILEFNPSNGEVKKAVEIASKQLRNVE